MTLSSKTSKTNTALLLSFFTAFFFFSTAPATELSNKCESLLSENFSAQLEVRSYEEIKQLKIMTYNVENLFMTVGKYTRLGVDKFAPAFHESAPQEKPAWQVDQIRKIISKSEADVLILQEVESQAALEKLVSESPLTGLYKAHLLKGNDPRGINIGFLVKTDLPFLVEHQTNKDVTWFDPIENRKVRIFSRDVPALLLRRAKNEKPFMIVLGNHAKSMRDRPGDPNSVILRGLQYEAMAKVITNYQKYYGKDVPILLGGDFNEDVRVTKRLDPIRPYLKSAFDLDPTPMPLEERVSASYHPRDSKEPVYNHFDDIMASPALAKSIIETKIIRYEDSNGNPLPLPRSYEERKKQPSDHFPVIVTIDTSVLFESIPKEATPGSVKQANTVVTKKRPGKKGQR